MKKALLLILVTVITLNLNYWYGHRFYDTVDKQYKVINKEILKGEPTLGLVNISNDKLSEKRVRLAQYGLAPVGGIITFTEEVPNRDQIVIKLLNIIILSVSSIMLIRLLVTW